MTQAQKGPQFEFVAGNRVLDFMATLAERGTTDHEKLQEPGDLAAWLQQAGVVTGRVEVSAEQLVEARRLREAMFCVVVCLIQHTELRDAHRTLLNERASGLPVSGSLRANGDVEWRGDVDQALAALALDLLTLLDGPDRAQLKLCAGARCTRVFVDRSRGGRRRWCAMGGCGDRAKAAAYRQRHQSPA